MCNIRPPSIFCWPNARLLVMLQKCNTSFTPLIQVFVHVELMQHELQFKCKVTSLQFTVHSGNTNYFKLKSMNN